MKKTSDLALRGIVPPLMTPLLESQELDENRLAALIRHVVDGGVHGLFPMGSAGEGTNVSRRVWARAHTVCLREADGEVPVYCGAIAPSTPQTIEQVKELEQLGAQYAVITPHFYMDTADQGEVLRHVEAIARQTEARLIIYNIPALTQVNIQPQTVLELSRMEAVVGYKDTCGNWNQHFQTLTLLEGSGLGIWSGGEELCGASLLFGAHGNIAGLANLFPGVFVGLYEAALRGDVAEVKARQQTINEMKRINQAGKSWLSGMKYAMARLGLGSETLSTPITPLTPEEKREVDALVEKFGMYA
ncbi:dihydrodipicolinate synthase family protein [Paenibacillus sp. 1P07SE]|uniref:dihydrodipicolinate synthase family protein n=1 Tax=Paenibacillus sp. 1P07SE TaxID=3132209 RepID=UPI0039A67568